ncbi:MAG: hypothetical protein KDK44_00420 [Chlamydiia bacterium]|nr:hypothetical protein [Chlamydiia bacterium]MCP5510092.1 hypothetical protein [Chlamydiales bacterium]HPE84840.1 glycosyltransferase family 9 protein [Chlamydiales bacterium]
MKAAVIPASGIGDGLMMMIASHRLQMQGYAVTTYHSKLPELADWFSTHRIECNYEDLSDFDLIILQNDNSAKAKELIRLFRAGDLPNLSVFYPTFEPQKHGEPTSLDQIFDPNKPMADNIAESVGHLLHTREISKNNGLTPPENLTYKKYPKRIIIHATAGEQNKIWPLDNFIWVAKKLEKLGYQPVFALSPIERKTIQVPYETPYFENFSFLAEYLYESGGLIGNDSSIGHLASNFHLPTVVVSNCSKRMKLWKPGWLNGEVVTPPRWIPNFKGSRVRKTRWRFLTPPSRVLKKFKTQMAFSLPSHNIV